MKNNKQNEAATKAKFEKDTLKMFRRLARKHPKVTLKYVYIEADFDGKDLRRPEFILGKDSHK